MCPMSLYLGRPGCPIKSYLFKAQRQDGAALYPCRTLSPIGEICLPNRRQLGAGGFRRTGSRLVWRIRLGLVHGLYTTYTGLSTSSVDAGVVPAASTTLSSAPRTSHPFIPSTTTPPAISERGSRARRVALTEEGQTRCHPECTPEAVQSRCDGIVPLTQTGRFERVPDEGADCEAEREA